MTMDTEDTTDSARAPMVPMLAIPLFIAMRENKLTPLRCIPLSNYACSMPKTLQ